MQEYQIRVYVKPNGKIPFEHWFSKLDREVKYKVELRLDRVENGNFGDCKCLGDGLWELRMAGSAGYRIYISILGVNTVLIVCAGNKATQQKDISKAKYYLIQYFNEQLGNIW